MKTLNLYFKNLQLIFFTLSIFILLSLPNFLYAQTTLYGDSATLGNGKVRTFIHVNSSGFRDQIGVSLTENALNDLDTGRQLFVLKFPVTPGDSLVNHMFFGWNPQGHPPPLGYYLPPHFDFHFTTTSISARESVIPGPDSLLGPNYTPPDHFYDPAGAIPRQGTHWADSTDPIIHGVPLTNSHTYGFYRGKLFFFEAHVARAYFLTNPSEIFVFKQPYFVDKAGYYPRQYSVTHNAGNQTYNVILQDFWKRNEDEPLPVELSSFVSLVTDRDVKLNWTTSTETNNSGFEVEKRDTRGETHGAWNKIGNVEGNGTVSSPENYEFTDRNLLSGKYNYRLKQIDYNGNYIYYDLQNEVVIGTPEKYSLSQNYPNPFNPNTVIRYSLIENHFTTLKVYDVLGNEIATLVNEKQNAGYYSVDFDSRDTQGRNLSSGVYFYKLAVDGNVIDTKRMMLLK
jgi:hypothetical protein